MARTRTTADRAPRRTARSRGTYAVGAGLAHRGHHRLRLPDPRRSGSSRTTPTTPRSTASGPSCSSSRPGFFLPLEQEVGRALAHRRARGHRRRAAREARARPRRDPRGSRRRSSCRIVAYGRIVDQLFHGDSVAARLRCSSALVAYYARAHHARARSSGNGRFGAVRHDARRRGIVRLVARASRCVVAGVDDARSVRPRARAPADRSRSSSRCAASRTARRPGPTRRTRSCRSALGYLLVGSVLAPGALVRGVPRRDRARRPPSRRTTRRPTSSPGCLHRPHPDPPVPGRAGRAAPEARALAGAGRHDDFRTGCASW